MLSGFLPKLRSPSVLPSHVTESRCAWFGIQTLGAAEGRADRQAAQGVRLIGSAVRMSNLTTDSFQVSFFSNDRPSRGWHRAGGFFSSRISLYREYICQEKSSPRPPLFSHCGCILTRESQPSFSFFLFLLLCAWFIHCKENALCSVHTNKRLLKESSFTLFFLCVCLLSQCWSRLLAVCESEIHEVKRTWLVALKYL